MHDLRKKTWIVQKFGGTSIGKFPDKVADIIITAKSNGYRPAVVCSARSSSNKAFGTTSRLLEVYRTLGRIVSAAHDSDMQSLLLENLRSIVRDIQDDQISALRSFVHSPEIRRETIRRIEEDCQKLLDYVDATRSFDLDINGRSKDKVVSLGEKLSCRFMMAILRDRKIEAEYVDLSEIIFASSSDSLKPIYFRNAAVIFGKRVAACNGKVPIITGFFGAVPGSLTNGGIGRGYSDLCAVLVAVGLQTKEVQIWKEVDGIFTADPTEVPKARCLPTITPQEAAELTFYGSEVIHHQALALAIQAEPPIQIRVKNVQNPASEGTVVAEKMVKHCLRQMKRTDSSENACLSEMTSSKPTAITIKRGITVINICSNKQSMSHGFFAKVFTILEDQGISVDLISTSEVCISMAISRTNTEVTQLEDACTKLTETGKVNVLPDMAILSLVGEELKNMTGVAGRMFAILGDEQVNIEMISQGASEINISCVIPAKDATRAINQLHAELLTNE
ncbi:hypothetical protein JX266_002317 [Neoarthrinium moseri]|nr:hypothetical protein JX266_002317 [Neoarthrinium moseri]